MAKFRKLPVVIDAFCWTGGPDQIEDPEWIIDAIKNHQVTFENKGTDGVKLLVHTLEGTMTADQGDWVIRGVKGEIYPCKPDIFLATYEQVFEPECSDVTTHLVDDDLSPEAMQKKIQRELAENPG